MNLFCFNLVLVYIYTQYIELDPNIWISEYLLFDYCKIFRESMIKTCFYSCLCGNQLLLLTLNYQACFSFLSGGTIDVCIYSYIYVHLYFTFASYTLQTNFSYRINCMA